MAKSLALDLSAGLPDVSVTVSEFVDLLNETYEFAFPSIVISGELANLRVSRGRWVYFDLKDESASVKFFGTIYNLPGPLEDGMLLNVRGVPHMHELYGFSVNVQFIAPVGEGSIRRAHELLQAKLQAEGLFDDNRKRQLPYPPRRIGLITSAQSAAYADFVKILAARWGGLQIDLVDVQVQGEPAAAQLVAAITRLNALSEPPDVIVLIRGGGSADDLACFSSELVTRAVATSRLPTLVAIGHEVDVSLAELAADRRASTPDKQAVLEILANTVERMYDLVHDRIYQARTVNKDVAKTIEQAMTRQLRQLREQLESSRQLLNVLSPNAALKRGYAIVRGSSGVTIGGQQGSQDMLPSKGDIVHIELLHAQLEAIVDHITPK
jgi:exodeoxyribonuclease VII large subunit